MRLPLFYRTIFDYEAEDYALDYEDQDTCPEPVIDVSEYYGSDVVVGVDHIGVFELYSTLSIDFMLQRLIEFDGVQIISDQIVNETINEYRIKDLNEPLYKSHLGFIKAILNSINHATTNEKRYVTPIFYDIICIEREAETTKDKKDSIRQHLETLGKLLIPNVESLIDTITNRLSDKLRRSVFFLIRYRVAYQANN